MSLSAKEHPDDIYCEDCGQRIFERFGEKNEGGEWIKDDYEKGPGVCSGPCERELCGNCGEWDDEGCCPKCHEEKPQPCAQCGEITDNVVNEEHCCPDCEKELMEQGEKKPSKGREDERSCHCNNCCARFREGEIKCKGDDEYCPSCGMPGFIEDDPPCCIDCPKKGCGEIPAKCKSPCPACPQEHDCYTESTDKRSECQAFIKFQEEASRE